MTTLRKEIRIDAPVEAVWEVLGDLESTPEWIPGVAEATVSGDRRVCRTTDGEEIHERIHGYDEAARTWSYAQSVVPLPITGSAGTLRVRESGVGSVVEWEARFDIAEGNDPEQLVPMIDGFYEQTLESLRRRVEGS